MMLRSPLPAAAASHTASHVSLPLFFFFLTSARGGAATARPLTSPLLARPRPGWEEGEGVAPRASASPWPRRPPGCGGEGRRAATAADGGGGLRAFGASLEGAEPSVPASPRRPGGGVYRSGSLPAWGRGAVPRVRDCPAAAASRLLSPPLFLSALPGLKAAKLRLREKRENCNPCLQPG
ncbi:translation initiation factor IF-2-like [Cebus imitator]|uniref:translation initiation factor IF-2-like n=1 Tax=Cebus imitator TaxID=2715852 RepID=UPI0018998AEF|nr:translation initiation factor IF-2-like [Cebus imitator]